MKISIDPLLFQTNDQFKIGMIHYTKIVVSESPQMIKGRTRLYQENLFFELQETPVTERPGIAEWRKVWKSFGADPNRYRHSAESLMRRIAKENYLDPFHIAVDLNNFFSLQYEIPVGIYDSSKIQGDVVITVGDEETGYEGLNSRYNSLNKIVCSKDEQSAFGSPFVDSIRTSVTEETTSALQFFYLRPSLAENECKDLLQSAGKMFCQVSGGDYKPFILSSNEPTILL